MDSEQSAKVHVSCRPCCVTQCEVGVGVVREITGHRMRVQLRIELATGVVVIDGEDQVPCDAILVGAIHPHTRRRRRLQFLQGRLNSVLMRLHEPFIRSECGHDRDRLRGREREVIQMSPPALDLAVHRQPVRTLPGPQLAEPSDEGVWQPVNLPPAMAAQVSTLSTLAGSAVIRPTRFELCTRPDAERLKRAEQAFQLGRYPVLYRGWLQDGKRALTVASSRAISDALDSKVGTIEPLFLPHSYGHLSPLVGVA
jgi:hypothetical protein